MTEWQCASGTINLSRFPSKTGWLPEADPDPVSRLSGEIRNTSSSTDRVASAETGTLWLAI
jgi:hypothetical protein